MIPYPDLQYKAELASLFVGLRLSDVEALIFVRYDVVKNDIFINFCYPSLRSSQDKVIDKSSNSNHKSASTATFIQCSYVALTLYVVPGGPF